MASGVHLLVEGPDDAGNQARRRLEELEARWSRFLPDSELTRLNRAGGTPTEVSADTCTLVARLRDAWFVTGGRFDPTTLPALLAAGYRASIDDPQLRTEIEPGHVGCMGASPPSPVGIAVDQRRRTVTLPAGVALDPGGLGKGLAADLVVDELLQRGATAVLVNIGGDLRAGGAPSGGRWPVEVEDPLDPTRTVLTLGLDAGGIATSSTVSRRWRHEGREHHHLIDPATGTCADTDLLTATVFAPTAWEAEAHATAALLAGRRNGWLHLVNHGLEGVLVAADHAVELTPGLALDLQEV